MFSLKIIICAIAMTLALYLGFDVSVFGYDSSVYERIGSLIAYIVTGAVLYYVFLRMLGVRLNTFKL